MNLKAANFDLRRTGELVREPEIGKRLNDIERRLDALEGMVATPKTRPSGGGGEGNIPSLSAQELLSIPDSLRKTLLTVQEIKEGTASDVAVKSARTRGIETIYLNHLTRLGYLARMKRGRKIFYKIARYY